MLVFSRQSRTVRLAAILGAALAVSACSSSRNPADLAASAGGAGGVARPGTAQDFSVNVGDRVYFLADQTDLSPEARGILDRQAQWLQRYSSYNVLIEGHADERGTREYNLALGARRSTNVRNYLASRGVNPSRVRNISYGKERPVAVCDDDSCWSQNRRAVTTLDGARGS